MRPTSQTHAAAVSPKQDWRRLFGTHHERLPSRSERWAAPVDPCRRAFANCVIHADERRSCVDLASYSRPNTRFIETAIRGYPKAAVSPSRAAIEINDTTRARSTDMLRALGVCYAFGTARNGADLHSGRQPMQREQRHSPENRGRSDADRPLSQR